MWNGPGLDRATPTFLKLLISLVLVIMLPALAQAGSLLGDDLRVGRCKNPQPYALAIHGGTARQPNSYESGTAFIGELLDDAGPALAEGAKSVDLVHAVVRAMEDSGIFNAGQGARANKAGVVELDAAIMDGKWQNAGAIASAKTIKNPITAALLLMQRAPQVMLVGPDAENFAARNRAAIVAPDYFRLSGLNFNDIPLPEDIAVIPPDPGLPAELAAFSGIWGGVFNGGITALLIVEEVTAEGARVIFGRGLNPDWNLESGHAARYDAEIVNGSLKFAIDHVPGGQASFKIGEDGQLSAIFNPSNLPRSTANFQHFESVPSPKKHGTVGAVALDRCGNLAAATSTGGFGSKVPGRIGDSPIIGAGTYANNATAAISATGHGEFFMRYVIAHDISASMEHGGLPLEAAVRKAIDEKLTGAKGRGGVIAVDAQGNVAAAYNSEGMVRGYVTDRQAPNVEVY